MGEPIVHRRKFHSQKDNMLSIIALYVSLGYYSHCSLGTKPLKLAVKLNPYTRILGRRYM